jgi:signal transduction histidine kinase
MRMGEWLQPPRQLLLAVVVVAVVSAGVLCWLGWLLVQQDAALERQRQADRLQQAADRAALAMRVALADLPARATQPATPGAAAGSLGVGLLRARMDASGLILAQGAGVLFVPAGAGPGGVPVVDFAAAEALEFGGDLAGALGAYQSVPPRSEGPRAAAALARVARVQRKLRQPDAAVATYGRLAALGSMPVDGLPAALVARVGRASVFEAEMRTSALHTEAEALRDDLLAGRWPLTRAEFSFYLDQAATWLGGAPISPLPEDLACADAVEWAWTQIRSAREPGLRALRLAAGPAIVAWAPTGAGRVHVIVADARHLAASCRTAAEGHRCAIRAADDAVLAGDSTAAGAAARLLPEAPGGPWAVHVAPLGPSDTAGSPRRPLLLITLALAGVVLAAGWYFILRGMARERAAVRVQADFVAAVSHEFRSPLTSMSHIADMLQSGRIAGGDSQARAYDVLVRDTERLRTLVEQLLEFGRFEAGGPVLRLDLLDVADAVRAIVVDFQARVAAEGYRVEYDGPDTPVWLHADREALTMALWNLMDNAVKYSPDAKTIWVRLRADASGVTLDVRDEGLGIPLSEQVTVFTQFVRGAEPKARRIRGTGIGLALVRHIARAHGGDVSVASEPGRGSTFTVRMQARKDGSPQ